jgi:hypothetical protein
LRPDDESRVVLLGRSLFDGRRDSHVKLLALAVEYYCLYIVTQKP